MQFSRSLKENRDFRRVYSRGKSFVVPRVVVYCLKNRSGISNRLGITVSTKTGKAVVRNKIRRRIREIYRLNEQLFRSGYDIVAVARVRAAQSEYLEIENDFLRACTKLGLLKNFQK